MLRCAAAGYDRAARAPFGRLPPRTREGDQLRAAARLLAMTGTTPGDGTGEAGALVANLVRLLEVVQGLREAQAHAAQAAAARHAAEELHAAFSQARSMHHHTRGSSGHADRDLCSRVRLTCSAARRGSTCGCRAGDRPARFPPTARSAAACPSHPLSMAAVRESHARGRPSQPDRDGQSVRARKGFAIKGGQGKP